MQPGCWSQRRLLAVDLAAVVVAALCLAFGTGLIIPDALDCTRSAHSVEVQEAAAATFACPEYFSNHTCCNPAEIASVEEKLQAVADFVLRVLGDQSEELNKGVPIFGDGQCEAYQSQLFASRLAHYREARQAAEKGLEILQTATIHMLCDACFVCTLPEKPGQIDGFTRRALQSLQDRMGAIFQQQLQADRPPAPECGIQYVAALGEGAYFPSWGRFSPEMVRDGTQLNVTFARWIDRVLSLILELPSTLLFQKSLLELAFYYAERPGSDAFKLFHGVEATSSPGQIASQVALRTPGEGLCTRGPRLFILVPQDVAAAALRQAIEQADIATAWEVRWVVTTGPHVEALVETVPRASVIWRRFPSKHPDALAAAICEDGRSWIANLTEVVDPASVFSALQRVASAPRRRDLSPGSLPAGLRPARPLPRVGAWPLSPLQALLDAHGAFRAALSRGERPLDDRVLIYTCTSVTFCGGHGDRLNGMLSAAVVAFLSGRHFFIDSQRPVPLALVLQPTGALDWRLFGSTAAFPAAFNWNDDLAGFERDPRFVLDHQASALRFVSNQRLTLAALRAAPQRAEALGLAPQPALHSLLFSLLFAPSPALRERLAARGLPSSGRRLIGIHFRAGDQMPNRWVDPRRHELAEVEEFLSCAVTLESELGWDAHFLLFADTDRAFEHAKVLELQESGKLLPPGQGLSNSDGLVHVDRSPLMYSVRGLLAVWADWWTLAFDVDALVVSHSGFGATALEIGPPRPARLGKGCVPADGRTV